MTENGTVLEVRGLKRVVGNNNAVLVNISFKVSSGEVLFIRGPSGCGKTVLLRAVAFLDQHQVRSRARACHAIFPCFCHSCPQYSLQTVPISMSPFLGTHCVGRSAPTGVLSGSNVGFRER